MSQKTSSRTNERRYLSNNLNTDNIDANMNGVDLEDLEKQRLLLLKQLANTM